MDILEKKWYVVNTYSKHENKVKSNLQRRIENLNLKDVVTNIVVAEVKKFEYKGQDKGVKEVVTNLFPGYLFVEMIMTDEAWYVVRNTNGVTGFIGSSGGGTKPFPVPDEEMQGILKLLSDNQKLTPIDIIQVGDLVKIVEGPLTGKLAKVLEIQDGKIAKLEIEGLENLGLAEVDIKDIVRED